MIADTDATETDSNSNSNQQRRDHTGLRTLGAHHSWREVYRACHVAYPDTDVLRTKARQRSRASTDRAQSAGVANSGDGATAAQDRAGESGVTL